MQVLFFPEKDLNGASMTYQVNVDGTCTDCQNFVRICNHPPLIKYLIPSQDLAGSKELKRRSVT